MSKTETPIMEELKNLADVRVSLKTIPHPLTPYLAETTVGDKTIQSFKSSLSDALISLDRLVGHEKWLIEERKKLEDLEGDYPQYAEWLLQDNGERDFDD